jgi:hypothetical protein
LQHPEIFPVCVACLCVDADDFSASYCKNFLFGKLSSKEKKRCLLGCKRLFFRKKARHTKFFCLWMMKNCQYQHKGKPHTQVKSQGAAISVEDATIIIRGLNLCGMHYM